DLLKQLMPHVTQVSAVHDPASAGGSLQLAAVQTVAPAFGVAVRPIGVRDPAALETAISSSALAPNSAFVVTLSSLAIVQRDLIIALAAHYRLPAIYPARLFVTDCG